MRSRFGISQPGKVAGELVGEASDVGQLLVVHITEPGHNFFSTFQHHHRQDLHLFYAAPKDDNVGEGGEK